MALVNLAAMVVEVGGGTWLGSAALLAEGYHMGAHVAAMLVAGAGYRLAAAARRRRGAYAARHVSDGAGLLNVLLLLAVATLLLGESIEHLIHPEPIPILAASVLAGFGLLVNIVSLLLLHHPQDHAHAPHRDLSFYAIYLHMIGDAGVGLLSMLALGLVAAFHWRWADGAAGLCGAALIAGLAAQILLQLRLARCSRGICAKMGIAESQPS